ncbi:MAG TPA: cupin domain-containing protein [Acetobacteraceae bacterium]|jgi:quercetin dioxygenase-like cupin family protein
MVELIRIGQVEVQFLETGQETGGALDMFEVTVPPDAKVLVAHHHRDYDETIYGLCGTLTWTLKGERREVGPGETHFIPRGAVHHFANLHGETAHSLAVLTPGLLGPGYFRDLAALIVPGSPPDLGRIREVMLRYGLVPVPC